MVVSIFLVFLGPVALQAELSKGERGDAKAMFSGRLFMRIDAPCEVGRQPFGVYYSPVVEISPAGSEEEDSGGFAVGLYHVGGTQLTIRVNDSVKLDELEFEEDTVEIELEGLGDANGEHTVIRFTGIHSLDDFRSAFGQAFAPGPLQDEHPDWPEEIRQAIAERRLVDGMSKRQAFYVVGSPERFEKMDEDGKEIEVWTLRSDARVKVGFFRTRLDTGGGPAESIRFEDGRLAGAGKSGGRNELSLDD
jgi:hypothetical protein